jgi:hypothetical protein
VYTDDTSTTPKIKLANAATGRIDLQITSTDIIQGQIVALVWSPDGKYIVSVANKLSNSYPGTPVTTPPGVAVIWNA